MAIQVAQFFQRKSSDLNPREPVGNSVSPLSWFLKITTLLAVTLLCLVPPNVIFAQTPPSPNLGEFHEIPILGTTYNQDWEPVGVVAKVDILFEKRWDHEGLRIQFATQPGRFSETAQKAVIQAISRVADASELDAQSWTVTLSLPYPGVTMYGESLSAMVALSVMAMAKGDPLPPDRVVTGTVTSDGHIGTVGGVPLKILAAHKEHLRRVLIPEERDVADGDWENPFLMEVTPVGSIRMAYQQLTDRPLTTVNSVTHAFYTLP